MTHRKIRVLTVNYGTPEAVIHSLKILAEERCKVPNLFADLLDNASPDNSAELLEAEIAKNSWGDWVKLIRHPSNIGYAPGANLCIQQSLNSPDEPDYYYMLNPDAYIRPGAIEILVNFMDAHPSVGLAGSQMEDGSGPPQVSGFRFPSIAGEFFGQARIGLLDRIHHLFAPEYPNNGQPFQADWVTGGSLMIRPALLHEVGLMDPKFFLYFDDPDLSVRARAFGWEAWSVPASRIVHLEGMSTGVKTKQRRTKYWFESRRYYFEKHHGFVVRVLADLAWILGNLVFKLRKLLGGRKEVDPHRFLSDFVYHSLRIRN